MCFNTSRSVSETRSSSNQEDNRVGASDNAVAVGAGGELTLNVQSPEALGAVVGLAGRIVEGGFDLAHESLGAQRVAAGQALAHVRAQDGNEGGDLVKTALKWGLPVLAIVGIAMVLKR
jgi:hypothetical protein